MAMLESLGVHTPVALPYLIREGLLPAEPRRDLYQWDTYLFDDGYGDVEEQVLATKDCVVWSQGDYIRNVFRFGIEGEEVIQAIVTCFPDGHAIPPRNSQSSERISNGYGGTKKVPTKQGLSGQIHTTIKPSPHALVVFLKTKAHVHFLQGSSSIVDLPFEVSRAFPAPRGCILQRKPAPEISSPLTPQLPSAPPNSFFSSQLQASSAYLRSPTLTRSFGGSQPAKPSPLSRGQGRLDSLFHDVFRSSKTASDDEAATLYTLTDTLSDLGVLSYAVQGHPKPLLSARSQKGTNIEFEDLGSSEDVVYVSPRNELGCGDVKNSSDGLMLIVTTNDVLQTLTIWHAWYVDEKSLRDLLKRRAAQKAAKARRRSSFMSVTMGTGATTPAVRQREATRESFAGPGLAGEPNAARHGAVSSRKPTRQEEEEAMASQMDPDYQPLASQQPPRENRRISSLNIDMRASQTAGNQSFVGTAGRRNTSFGGPGDRRSFGHRKSRGSTPGSVFSRSLGPDDDLMDVDSDSEYGAREDIDGIVRHICATFEAAGTDRLLGCGDDGFQRELVVRKVHSVSSWPPSSSGNGTSRIHVATLSESHPPSDRAEHRLNVYVHDRHSQDIHSFQLLVKQRQLWPEVSGSPRIAIPVLLGEKHAGKCSDIMALRHDRVQALLLAGQGVLLSVNDEVPCPLPNSAPYRVYNSLDVLSQQASPNIDVGKSRTLQIPEGRVSLSQQGAEGSFDEVDSLGVHHRRRLQLRPNEAYIDKLLEVCEVVLPKQYSFTVRRVYYVAHSRLHQDPAGLVGTADTREWAAFCTTVLVFSVKLLSAKAKAALQMSRMAAGKHKVANGRGLLLQRQLFESRSLTRPAWSWLGQQPPSPTSLSSARVGGQRETQKDQLLHIVAALADELARADAMPDQDLEDAQLNAVKLMLGLHIFREEQKLHMLSAQHDRNVTLAPLIAQIGLLLGLRAWTGREGAYYANEGASEAQVSYVGSMPSVSTTLPIMNEPVSLYQWLEYAVSQRSNEGYPSLATVARLETNTAMTQDFERRARGLTPRITALSELLADTNAMTTAPDRTVELMAKHGFSVRLLETLPEAVAAPLKEAIARCERAPPTSWTDDLLRLVGREDLETGNDGSRSHTGRIPPSSSRDVQSVCHAIEHHHPAAKTREATRHAVSQLIFSDDRRLVEATALMHYNSIQVAECPKEPEWTDAHHFEQQRRVMHFVTLRMLALPAGDGMIHYDCQMPLLTEEYTVAGFSSHCLMQPMGHNLTIDRADMTQEKQSWAYFHAGASAGLRISRSVKGIDTSWIAFNKPAELTNRHAGLLLALGLGGHLRSLAKWLSFKYLTPKHTMTSVGLLLGLSASYMGTMDSLITRMLSVHITRMLPPGAAELNVSPTTQTAGLMGIGLLYHNTQHRRMSEIVLSEIEYMEVEDPDSGPDPLRDESYRLAAGFALGLINIGKGNKLRGLQGMYLPERLLAVTIGSRPVHAVHVFDRATAGAIIAVALIYMKTGDESIARKVDVPDTEAQFDHVRPDMLMLRAMARHLIMWETIKSEPQGETSSKFSWIQANLPTCFKTKLQDIDAGKGRYPFKTSDVPFYNIVTGLAWALSLKYAGSADSSARDEILAVLDLFYMISGESYYYDAKLARSTVRRCIDVLALCAAVVMAGTGDVKTFRYLRRLHGRTDADTNYGSHLAAHLGIGALFMGGGTYSFSTSNLAVAALICAFYPLFPTEVHDNRVHLQAFRHFWVLAAEARCLVVEDIDTQRPIRMPVTVTMKNGTTRNLTAPCLLPELDLIASVQTSDSAYWTVTLDFVVNPAHLASFRTNQTVRVRRCPAAEAHTSVFSTTLAALNDAQTSPAVNELWQAIFSVPALRELNQADIELILPPDLHSSVHLDERGTVVDDRLVLQQDAVSTERDRLWNLRVLFAWAERAKEDGDGRIRWIGEEVVEALRARIDERSRMIG